ncbi:MAG: hypothetical protein J6336_04300, partial [Kiritimatiellae bacterium]|nr:hypothetical protein [Kiritimatiellia bacterium]
LGDSAVVGAAGSNGGTITVKEGGQFDFNHIDTASGNGRARARITSGKTFMIEGAGPDGSGALTSTADNTYWGSPINEVILTGDATIGGKSRIDIRGGTKNSITGPDDATLTIKNSAVSRTRGLNVHGPISVGKMVIAEEGCYTPEGSAFTLNIPNGIELAGALSMWGSTGKWNVGGLVVVGDNAYIGNDSGTSYVDAPVTVSDSATLTMGGGATTRYREPMTNKGTVLVQKNGHYLDAPLVNEGDPVMRLSTDFHNFAPTVTGDSRVEVTGGYYWTTGNQDWGDSALDVTLSGGTGLVLGMNNDGYGMPKFGKNKLSVTAMNGNTATFFFHPSASASIDGVTINGLIDKFFSQGPNVKTLNAGPVVNITANDLVFSANRFEIGTGNGRGELTVTGADTHIFTKGLYANWVGSHYYAGSLTFRDGLLEIGSDGISEAWVEPMRTVFNMESGTLRAAADFAIGKAGMTATFGSPKRGGEVTFDLNGKSVLWGTGLAGASDVTLTGAGSFAPDRAGIQGIPLGKWTVESTGTIDLSNAAGFAGGLSLAENAIATLDIAGTNMVEFVAWTWHDNAWNVMKPYFEAGMPISTHVATSLTYFNRPASAIRDVKYGNGSGFNYFGEFYVNADQVGKWYFAQRNQTHFGIQVDGTELSRLGPNSGAIYNIDLTEGWHKFMISIYTGSANQTIGPMTDSGDVAKENGIWFKVGGNGNGNWPADYAPFDSTTVPMRMRSETSARTSVRVRKFFNPTSNLNIYSTCDESKFATLDVITNSIALLHVKYSTGTNAPFGGTVGRFDGYFHVAADQVGQWSFNGSFDDQISLDVDGRRLFAAAANCASVTGGIVLDEGWHKFDIRVGDNSANTSGGSGGLLTDADGNVCALMFSVNGGSYHSFDERYLPIAYTAGDAQKFSQPGLGGETELAAGSMLVNAPREGGFCPIHGTLKGAGTLAGPFRFTGEENCWEVSGDTADGLIENTVTFEDADPQTLAGLKHFRAVFNTQPTRSAYLISSALGLTDEAAAAVRVTVEDITGKDYSEDFSLMVKSGKLMLRNARPGGMYIILH